VIANSIRLELAILAAIANKDADLSIEGDKRAVGQGAPVREEDCSSGKANPADAPSHASTGLIVAEQRIRA
jgi:hypothetical protein